MSKATVLTDFGMDPPALVIESLELSKFKLVLFYEYNDKL